MPQLGTLNPIIKIADHNSKMVNPKYTSSDSQTVCVSRVAKPEVVQI
jgi:hypothetical protein